MNEQIEYDQAFTCAECANLNTFKASAPIKCSGCGAIRWVLGHDTGIFERKQLIEHWRKLAGDTEEYKAAAYRLEETIRLLRTEMPDESVRWKIEKARLCKLFGLPEKVCLGELIQAIEQLKERELSATTKLDLLNSFYASNADEDENEKLALATRRMIDAEVAWRTEVAHIGNIAGGPTVEYAPLIAKKEQREKLDLIAVIVSRLLTSGPSNAKLRERAFARGRLFQFERMKKERPIDPIYWDSHEEQRLREAAEE
jgi:hypothetical protein